MNDKSFEKYFQNELSNLKDLAKEFSKEHPAVAPLLSANSSDPDVERLLEGVAFLTGLLNQKLDEEFPEVVHGLMNILFPHYLKPIPAMSIIEFFPKPSLREMIKIDKGTVINSVPIDETQCSFTTTSKINLYPIHLEKTLYTVHENDKSSLELDISLVNTNLGSLNLSTLSFYLGDDYTNASNLFMLLESALENISIEVDGKILLRLKSDALECEGFNTKNSLFTYPKNAFTGYRLLQEYFILPQKFFFFNLTQLEGLKKSKGSKNFKVIFNFKNSLVSIDSFASDTIKLFCSPISNIFNTQAEPVTLKHQKELIHIRVPINDSENNQVYDILDVSGYIQGENDKKQYFPFEAFEEQDNGKNIYQVYRKTSIIDAREDVYIGLHYPNALPTKKEVLSVKISCTNGLLPERLNLGEISQRSQNSPEQAIFKNIMPCTLEIDSPINEDSLWQFVSHLSINLLTLADMKTFKEMLRLYIFSHNRDKAKVAKNKKRIDAIEDFQINPIDRVRRGYLLKGHKVTMKVRQDYFASIGDLYLFCSVILRFLSNYAALNTFVELEVQETTTGESLSWAPILGNKILI